MAPVNWPDAGPGGLLLPSFDEELEQYRLLAYLQRVERHYGEHKLYPLLEDLEQRIARLQEVLGRGEELKAQIRGQLLGLDLARGELVRAPVAVAEWDRLRDALDRCMAPLLQARERGQELRAALEGQIRVEPIGLLPLDVREGWLLLRTGDQALIYAYALPLVRRAGTTDQYRHVRTRYYASCTITLANTYDRIKSGLARSGPLPNPAMFAFESDMTLPRIETYLPLAKRITYELVSSSLPS